MLKPIDMKFDKDGNAIIIITCPNCNKQSTEKASNIKPGTVVKCTCNYLITFNGDDVSNITTFINNFKRRFK
jgi:hypothetical protein